MMGWGVQASSVLTHRLTVAAVNVSLLVLVTYSLAQWTWRLARPAEKPRPTAVSAPPEFDIIKVVQAANLFGVASGSLAPVGPGGHAQVPRTSLNLVLSGVVMRGTNSYALLSADGGPETPFSVGQAILPGVVLESVHPDRVIILRGGAREAVILKELAAALPPGAISQASPPSSTRPQPVRATSPTSAVVDRGLMQKQLQKPEFLSQALIVPNPGGGFQVREVQAGSVYEKLGLRVGDVIRSVNGEPVNNMDEVMRIYQQFGGESQINVEVVRAGKSETLHYDVH
jgi:general secretion pathway protein C